MRICGTKCQIMSTLAGLLLIAIGYLIHIYWESLLNDILRKKFALSTTSRTYDSWIKTKVPVYCSFYLFNWTNPSDLSLPNYKPRFEEVGPYVFLETLEKVDVVFNDNGTVTYRLKRNWYFERKLSIGPLTDKITSANPVAAAVKYRMRDSFSMSALTRIAAPDGFFTKSVKTVDELLFTGYEDKLIDLGRFSQMFFSGMKEIPYDRFGWWYPRNGSISEVYIMETGENGMDVFGVLTRWNHKRNTGAYNGSCADVFGSGGNFWPWNMKKTDDAAVFSGDICRSIPLSFVSELSYNGLNAYRFESGPEFVDNGTLDGRNECLCNGECLPVGVFNASSCSKDAPVFISYPHFQYGDPYYTDAIEGMQQDRERHNMYLILDPKYGVPLELSARIQINLLVETTSKQRNWGQDVKKRIFFPVMWVDQSFKILNKDLETLKFLRKLPQMGFIASIVSMVAGVVLLSGCVALRMSHKSRKVPFRDMRAMQINDGKVTESNEKNNIKFNYLKDSHL